ncbi:MAG: alpha/beta fold hydrolase, partial [Gemmatimonadota bacterium]
MTATPAAQAIWFGSERAPLFGWYHRPAPGRSIGQAAVLCNPFGYEALTTHRSYRVLAEQLAAQGIATLRFDYEGTGDSSGEDPAPGRVASWQASIAAALAESRRRSRGLPVTLVGLRLGASLAMLAAAGDQHVAALVLWTPFIAGKHLVRELRAVRMMGEGESERTGS